MNTLTIVAVVNSMLLLTSLRVRAGLPGDWQVRPSPTTAHLNAVIFGPDLGVVVGNAGAILTSYDGQEWARVSHRIGTGDFLSIAYGNGLYVAGGNQNALLAVSADGVNWTSVQTTASVHANLGITFALGRFVVVGRGNSPAPTNCRLITSTNGVDWEYPLKPTTNVLRGVAHGNGQFVAVGDNGTIISSPDAITWTNQSSGIPHHLRTIVFTGWEFLAGGDSSTLLTSSDGRHWSPVAFSAFDLKGIATCGTALVGVGKVGTAGRVQASADGLAWPGSSSNFAQPLNAVAHDHGGRFFAVGNSGLILESGTLADMPVNRWAKTSDGYWDEAFWTLGHLPSLKDSFIVMTNDGVQTLEIDSTTTRDYPESLRVRSVRIGGAVNSHNTLFLNHAGLFTPLMIQHDLIVGPHASLVSYQSALDLNSLRLGGRAVFSEGAESQVSTVLLGENDIGSLTFSNGTFMCSRMTLGYTHPAIVNQFGGTNEVRGMYGLELNNGGVYNLRDGALTVVHSLVLRGGTSLTRFDMSGGVANVGAFVLDPGEVLLSGGLLRSLRVLGRQVAFTQSGGKHETGDIEMPTASQQGSGTYLLSNGRLESASLRLGHGEDARGSFIQQGGEHFMSGSIQAGGSPHGGPAQAYGTYSLSGGLLNTRTIALHGGTFSQSAGTNEVSDLLISTAGSYELSGGMLVSSNAAIEGGINRYLSRFTQSDGVHRNHRELKVQGAEYDLQGGLLVAPRIQLVNGELKLNGGHVSRSDIELFGGALKASGTHSFGQLRVTWPAVVDFQSTQTSLRFENTEQTGWTSEATLVLSNWTAGADQFFVGGLSATHLSRMTFFNPGGFPPGTYRAHIKSNGEIVPVPVTVYQRAAEGLGLTWPPGYQLFTSTNVSGPYEVMTGATSPLQVSYADPQRFFVIRSAP